MGKPILANRNSSEKYDVEIIMLNAIISKVEKKNPKEETPSFFTLQEMKRRRENIYLSINQLD
jgi:hypothetical protein